MKKLKQAAKDTGIKHVALAGGVSANSALRKAFQDMEEKGIWKIYIPKFSYTTDNAAMIAMSGHYRYLDGEFLFTWQTRIFSYSILTYSFIHTLISHFMDLDLKVVSKEVNEILWRNHQTLSVAESCTSGRIASVITAVPGSSQYFKGGVIAYANEVKINLLGVDAQIIEEKTPVCEEVAVQNGTRRA